MELRFKILQIHLDRLKSEAFSAGHSSEETISLLLVVTEGGSNSCKVSLNTAEEDGKDIREATVSLMFLKR